MVIHQIEKKLFTLRLALELQENNGKSNAKNNEKPETDAVVPPLGRESKAITLKTTAWETTLHHDDAPATSVWRSLISKQTLRILQEERDKEELFKRARYVGTILQFCNRRHPANYKSRAEHLFKILDFY